VAEIFRRGLVAVHGAKHSFADLNGATSGGISNRRTAVN